MCLPAVALRLGVAGWKRLLKTLVEILTAGMRALTSPLVSSVFGKRVIRIAIEPALARLCRCDHVMPRRASVLCRVTVGRVVATMRATALLTGTEMNPCSADLDALLAFPSLRVLDAGDRGNVDATLIGHDTPYGRST
jgi:hypothetical protein